MAHASTLTFRISRATLTLPLLAGLSLAHASGYDGPYDNFVSRAQPDIPLASYEAGVLGILLPTYPRIFLYPAWRAIVSGKPTSAAITSQTDKATSSPLKKACCDSISEWYEYGKNDPQLGPSQWLAVRRTVSNTEPRVTPAIWREVQNDGWLSYRNCPDPAWGTAANNLKTLQTRNDATPQRLQAWVGAQDAVFEFCGYVKGAGPRYGKAPPPPPEIPAPLPASEPAVWRQWREYQIAASYFYGGQFEQAEQLFEAIGTKAGHPMQAWGKYLALRTKLRQLTLNTEWDKELRKLMAGAGTPAEKTALRKAFEQRRKAWQETQMVALTTRGERILAQPALQPVHEAVRATLRTAAFRLTPEQRFAQLSEQLNNIQVDPHINDALADWRRLANDLLDGYQPPLVPEMRTQYAYFDWIRTVQGCEGTLRDDKTINCSDEHSHAIERWQASRKLKRAEAAAWMTAALITANDLTPELRQAAERVAETAPEYLTIQYHLVRLQRMAGQTNEARARADALLANSLPSIGAINLLRRERFAMATGLDDAARFVHRARSAQSNPDTGQNQLVSVTPEPPAQIDNDAERWLNERLSIAELLKLSESPAISPSLRISLATAAWWRAELLRKPALANAAAERSADLLPRLRPLAQSYTAEQDTHERRHLLVMASLINFLSPVVMDMPQTSRDLPKNENVTASAWCNIGPAPHIRSEPLPLREPEGPAPQASSAQAVSTEIAALSKISPATNFVGAHVLQRLQLHPTDPDLPWLLYVTVQSTRGGCLGTGSSALSRRAFNELHSRFKSSVWAQKTPYWY